MKTLHFETAIFLVLVRPTFSLQAEKTKKVYGRVSTKILKPKL